jgi:hypothetical protein
MAQTTNLLVTKIEASQAQKEVTANNAFDAFDKAVAGALSQAITSADVTLTDDQGRNAIITLTGTLTGNRNLIVPTRTKLYLVHNNTSGAFTVTVKTAAGTGVVVPQGEKAFVYCDGTNVVSGPGSTSGQVYDVAAMKAGEPGASEVILRFVAARAFRLPQNLTGSYAVAVVAADATTTFAIKKNGSDVGSFEFASAADDATFTMASNTDFAAGDVLTIVAPASPDADLADIAVTLKGALL